jgi:hypothetical protein
MPTKFKPTERILIDRKAKKYQSVNYYLKNTSTEDILEALTNPNVRLKNAQKYRNELGRRGVL